MLPTKTIYVSGNFDGLLGFGSTQPASAGSDAFLAKFAPSGACTWAQRFGDATPETGAGVAADAASVYLTGYFQGTNREWFKSLVATLSPEPCA